MKISFLDRQAAGAVALAVGVLLGVIACGGSDPQQEPSASAPTREVTQVEGGQVAGKLIHSDELEPGHVVKYFEVSQGAHLAMETLQVGQVARIKLESSTLKQMYADTMGASRELPEALRAADDARARVVASNRSVAAPVLATAERQRILAENPREVALSSTACSEDVYGDNWGTQWFDEKVCQPKGADMCRFNRTDYDEGRNNYAGYKATTRFFWGQMEGDFDSTGRSEGYAFPGWGGPDERVTLWDYQVPPRSVVRFTFTSANSWFYGGRARSPCGHAHVASRWTS